MDRPAETPVARKEREIRRLLGRAKGGDEINDAEVEYLREYRDTLLRANEIAQARLNP